MGPPEAEALRVSLHLNVALAALKLDDFALAEAACDFVLARDPGNVKATFRLARAHEGHGHLKRCIRLLTRVVALEPTNAEARDLRKKTKDRLEDLRWQYGDWLEGENRKLYREKRDWEPPPLHEGRPIPPQGIYKRTYYLHPYAKRALVLFCLAVLSALAYAYWGTVGPACRHVRANAAPAARAAAQAIADALPVLWAAAKRGADRAVSALFDASTWTRQAAASGAVTFARALAALAVDAACAAGRGSVAAARGLFAFLFSRPGQERKRAKAVAAATAAAVSAP